MGSDSPSTRWPTRSGRSSGPSRTPDRVAVAMSGGVDSAVALLRAGPAAIGVTLRLWIDPEAPDSERACCSPEAVIAARETCHALGIPHVTLDAREAFRLRDRAVHSSRGTRGARRRIPARAATAASASRSCSRSRAAPELSRLATGHYARIVEHRGRRLLARAADPNKDQSYMLARLDPRHLERLWFPLGEQTKEETRARPSAPGSRSPAARRARRRASWAGATTASSSSATAFPLARDGRRRGGRARLEATPGSGASLRVSGAASACPRGSRATRFAATRRRTRSSWALARLSRGARSRRRAGCSRRSRGATRSSATAPRRSPPTSRRRRTGFRLRFDEPAYGVASGQTAVVYEEDVVVGSGTIASSAA